MRTKERTDSLYKYTRLEFLNSTLLNGIYASNLNELNDPYECFGYPEELKLKVVCLSRSRNKKLMWSHYANGHRGCSIKIVPPNDYGTEDCELKRVQYSSKIIRYPNIKGKEFIEQLYIKDKKWEYELEVRAVFDPDNYDEDRWKIRRDKTYYQVKISQVDFGCFADRDPFYLDALIVLRDYNTNHKKKIKVRKYKMSDKKYEFIIDKEFDYIKEIAKLTNEEATE